MIWEMILKQFQFNLANMMKNLKDESDGDSDLAENGEEDFWDVDLDDLDYLAFEEELGYAPL